MFDNILLAYDGSDHADKALDVAIGLTKTHGSQLSVVHIPQLDTPPIVIGAQVALLEPPLSAAQVAKAGKKIVEQAANAAEAKGVALSGTHLGRGAPADFILAVAEDSDADLIIMGRRGLGALGSLTMGSVSLTVAHSAKCACLTVL